MMVIIKVFIKQNLPYIYNRLVVAKKSLPKKVVKNYFKTNYRKTALLSYIVKPFIEGSNLRHTNHYESMSIAMILNDLGYRVDIIGYDDERSLDFNKYSILIGFGDSFKKYYESGCNHLKTIYYGTGMDVCHQNNMTLKRLKNVFYKKGEWVNQSIRYVEKSWTYQTILVDGMIVLGNNVCKESYEKYFEGIICNIPAPFYKTIDGYEIMSERDTKSDKGFLWFGGSGLIHKGLDLVLEAFVNRPEATLHVCGPINNEPTFKKLYYKELYQTPHIKTHDFVDISSEQFNNILKECSFSIFPSCSEGGSPSLITSIGNGALIPIITKETSVSTGSEIWIKEFTSAEVEKAINKALSLKDEDIIRMQEENLAYVCKYHSQDNYYNELKRAIKLIILT
jgi:hypothetical protein